MLILAKWLAHQNLFPELWRDSSLLPVCLGVDTWQVVVGGIHPKSKLSQWAGHQYSPEEHLGPFIFYCSSHWFLKSHVIGIWCSEQKQGGQQPFWKGIFMQVCWMNVQVSHTFDPGVSKLCFYLDLLAKQSVELCIFLYQAEHRKSFPSCLLTTVQCKRILIFLHFRQFIFSKEVGTRWRVARSTVTFRWLILSFSYLFSKYLFAYHPCTGPGLIVKEKMKRADVKAEMPRRQDGLFWRLERWTSLWREVSQSVSIEV